MFPRPAAPIAFLLALPALAGCGNDAVAPPPPLSPEARAAVAEEAGAPSEQVARAVDALFTADGVGETRAVILMSGGRIVAERYAPGYGPDTRFVSWSMAKTLTAVMIGMLVADGRLSLDAPAPVPRWQRPGDPRGAITLRHLLQMRSGLRHTESGDPPYESSEVRMLFLDGRDNMASFAESQPLEAEPGKRFEYSSNTTVILADIAARTLAPDGGPAARREAVGRFLADRLFTPLGMRSIRPEYDRAGTMIGGSLVHANARDWARLGDLMRTKGSYKGTQLVPRGWVEAMARPSPTAPQYGFQTWLNRPLRNPDEEHPLFPDAAPRSVFAAIGHMGQFIIVSPEQRLTLVRLGHSDDAQIAALRPKMAAVLALYPER